MKRTVNYVASYSGGKDSTAMVIRLMELGMPLTHIVFYNTGMEFSAVVRNAERIRRLAEERGIIFTELSSETNWLMEMLVIPRTPRGENEEHYGYDWCGFGRVRWRTACKVSSIGRYIRSLPGETVQYIGYAADEESRMQKLDERRQNVRYPLIEWQMTEAECLKYCYDHGWDWKEDGVELYTILDRVSCWCCAFKNLNELRNIYHYLPRYWGWLRGLQSRIDRPFKKYGSIFDLEERFREEDAQLNIYSLETGKIDKGNFAGESPASKNIV